MPLISKRRSSRHRIKGVRPSSFAYTSLVSHPHKIKLFPQPLSLPSRTREACVGSYNLSSLPYTYANSLDVEAHGLRPPLSLSNPSQCLPSVRDAPLLKSTLFPSPWEQPSSTFVQPESTAQGKPVRTIYAPLVALDIIASHRTEGQQHSGKPVFHKPRSYGRAS